MAIPVTQADALRQLRLTSDEVDTERRTEISTFIADAADWVERYTGHILVARDVTEELDGFGSGELRAWPVKADAVPAVTYVDRVDVVVPVLARTLLIRRPARIAPLVGARWPSLPWGAPVTVTVRAGYETGDPVPPAIRRAMLVLIAAYDADREGGDMFQKAEETARTICNRAGLRLRRV